MKCFFKFFRIQSVPPYREVLSQLFPTHNLLFPTKLVPRISCFCEPKEAYGKYFNKIEQIKTEIFAMKMSTGKGQHQHHQHLHSTYDGFFFTFVIDSKKHFKQITNC